MVEKTAKSKRRADRPQRIRHVAWAAAIALVFHILTVLAPLDQLGWVIQSRIVSQPASGEIVFVGSQADLADPELPGGRRQLADLIDRLNEAGAAAVYVDYVFEKPATAADDARLNEALRNFGGNAYLVRDLKTDVTGGQSLLRNADGVGNGIATVAADQWSNYLGFIWDNPYRVSSGDENLVNLPASIAQVDPEAGESFPVNYVFDLATIPTFQFADIIAKDISLDEFANKTVVIGSSAVADAKGINIPGHIGVPPSIVAIYAAETLSSGRTRYIGGLITLVLTIVALLGASIIKQRKIRHISYAALSSAIPVALLAAATFSVRLSAADAAAVIAIYGFNRWRTIWKRNAKRVDVDTGLPTFAAMEVSDDIAEAIPAIIVAKIHRFEDVRRSLPTELHTDYLLAITGRLKAATQDATIYLGQGHLIAWTMDEKDPALLREHLEGLRALFSSPLLVAEQQVDVGITFGVDISPSPNVARRLTSAVAAAEQTTETFEPIAIADSASQEDLIWNISLQARIDAALANGEIYLAYQPKIMVQTGEMIGVESLVRWKDPVRGQIPPDNFIRQCETAGRMSQLTRFVLREACRAGIGFAEAGLDLPVAVNISATLLHERSIVQMVANVVDETGFDPRKLTLEITETYRISNLDRAADILGELKKLGLKISMDDFGVGAASLEALLRLPFSELKIDRMFVAPMASNAKALGIVKNILRMGKDLRIAVVAEGVEDAGTLTLLRDSGCLLAQGFAISRPVTFDKIVRNHGGTQTGHAANMV